MSKSIRISEKHGVNPSILKCPVCAKDQGVALHGRLPEDSEAPKNSIDLVPCMACYEQFEHYKTMGFILFVIYDEYEIAVAKKAKNKPTPWQFFHSVNVIRKEAIDKIFKNIDKSQGCAFISLTVGKQVGIINEDGTIRGGK